MSVRTPSLLRGIGVAAAVLLPDRSGPRRRALVTGGSYLASGLVDPDGIQVLSLSLDDERLPGWVNRAFPPASAVASWVLAQQALVPVVRLLPLPRPVAAGLYGAAVYAADARLAGTVLEARARAAAPAPTPEQASAPNG